MAQPPRRRVIGESAADIEAALAPGQSVTPRARRQPVQRVASFTEVRATSPDEIIGNIGDISIAAGSIREMAITQTLDGMRRAGPVMIAITREIVQGMIDNTPDYDPENDQLALALARYDAENAPPAADPEPEEPTPPPAPSRPVRRWED